MDAGLSHCSFGDTLLSNMRTPPGQCMRRPLRTSLDLTCLIPTCRIRFALTEFRKLLLEFGSKQQDVFPAWMMEWNKSWERLQTITAGTGRRVGMAAVPRFHPEK